MLAALARALPGPIRSEASMHRADVASPPFASRSGGTP
jgi:hypothetical protein